jgi:hypothetical protein
VLPKKEEEEEERGKVMMFWEHKRIDLLHKKVKRITEIFPVDMSLSIT